MDETTIRTADSTPDSEAVLKNKRRTRWARFALLAFALGGILLFREAVPSKLTVSFGVAPTVYSGGVGTPRGELTALEARIFVDGDDAAEVARTTLSFPGGLGGPVTPTVALSLPGGRYLVRGRFTTRTGRALETAGAFTVDDEERLRVELE